MYASSGRLLVGGRAQTFRNPRWHTAELPAPAVGLGAGEVLKRENKSVPERQLQKDRGYDWRLAVGGDWRLAVGDWRLVAVGGGWRRLVVGDWWLMAVGSGWRLAVGRRWRLAVGRRWRLAVGDWRLVVVGGWWRLEVPWGGP